MAGRHYSVTFILADLGSWQYGSLGINEPDLANALFNRFVAKLTKKFPGALSEDGKRFFTTKKIPFVEIPGKPPTFSFEVEDLLPESTKPESLYQRLKEVQGSENVNKGTIILKDDVQESREELDDEQTNGGRRKKTVRRRKRYPLRSRRRSMRS